KRAAHATNPPAVPTTQNRCTLRSFHFPSVRSRQSAARPVIHPNLDQEHMPTVLYARHLASMLVIYAGMVLNRALVESTNRGFMLNEGKADVLPDEAVGASERRNATERKIADPNTCQIAARRRCTLGGRRAAHEGSDNPCAQEPDPTEPHDSSSRWARAVSKRLKNRVRVLRHSRSGTVILRR